MGPFELLDFTGLDVSAEVTDQIWKGFDEEPRFRLAPIARRRVAAGLFGRKTGKGFYAYDAAGKAVGASAAASDAGTGSGAARRHGPATGGGVAALLPPGAVTDDAGAVALVGPVGTDVASEAAPPGPRPGRDRRHRSRLHRRRHPCRRAGDPALVAGVAAAFRAQPVGTSPSSATGRACRPSALVAMMVLIAADAGGAGHRPPRRTSMPPRVWRSPTRWGRWSAPMQSERPGSRRSPRGFYALTGDPRWRPSPWLDARVAGRPKASRNP